MGKLGCPHCNSPAPTERRGRTDLGYRRFRCCTCHREFNERTGTRFNHLQYPTDNVCLVVLWRVGYTVRLRDRSERCLARGISFTHEAVREGDERTQTMLMTATLLVPDPLPP